MSGSDAISVFAEGTFEEQILELVTYLARSLPEDQRQAFVQPFRDALATAEGQSPLEQDEERRRGVVRKVLEAVKDLGDGSEREIEGFFNLLFAHVLSLFPLDASETSQYIVGLLQTITDSNEPSSTKYCIISNLFNTIPQRSGLRLPVQRALIEVASANDELDRLSLSVDEVERWLSEWQVSSEEKSAFFKLLVQAYEKAGNSDTSYQFTLAHVRSMPPSPSATSAALYTIAVALRSPNVFNFDPLFRLDAVVSAKDNELFSLLQIFLNDSLPEYKAWEASHGDFFAKHDLDKSQLERKIRLLSLATLAFQNVGRDVPYSVLSTALQVEQSDVERWVIDGIRAGLVSGKLSQTAQTFHVVRATARVFEREQWEILEKRLVAWKTGLVDVLEVVAAAKKKNGTDASATTVPNGIEASAQQPQEAAA